MNKKLLYLVVVVTAKEGQAAFVHEELTKLLAPTRAEEGNISYNMYHDNKDPNTFVFFERWTGKEALEAHMQTEPLKHFTEVTKDALALWTIRELTKMDECPCACDR